MQKELYIDVLFFVNYTMDFLILLTVNKILKCTATHIRIAVGALLGAGLTCLVIVIPLPVWWGKMLCFHLIINTIMVITGLHIHDTIQFIKAMLLLYFCACLYGGIMNLAGSYSRQISLFFVVASLTYILVSMFLRILYQCFAKRGQKYKVTLHIGNRTVLTTAFVDTGNGLYDPYSLKPVSVLEKGQLQGEPLDDMQTVHWIPYSSLGVEEGTIPVFTIDQMHVENESEDKWIQKPVIALWDGKLDGKKECHMILNPDVMTLP